MSCKFIMIITSDNYETSRSNLYLTDASDARKQRLENKSFQLFKLMFIRMNISSEFDMLT